MQSSELLDKTYELEGLLLLYSRQNNPDPELKRLINKRGKEFCDLFLKSEFYENSGSEETEEDIHTEEVPEYNFEEYNIEEEQNENLPENLNLPEYIYEEDGENGDDENDDENDYEEEDEQEKESSKVSNLKSNNENTERGKLVFSINDRFRYKNELFNNSDADFNNTLVLIASMDNFEEAEEYIINESGFSYSNPVVVEFMEIIKRYFK